MANNAKELLKTLARTVLGEYSAYYVYASPKQCEDSSHFHSTSQTNMYVREVDAAAVSSCAESLIQEQIGYLGAESHTFACYAGDQIAGVCIYWFAERYKKRNFWPLKESEAKLIQIVTVPTMRGKGIAATLIAASCRDMLDKGFSRTYARIWHSNTPSIRAFERAGWLRIAIIIEFNPFRRRRPFRICFDLKSQTRK